MQTRDLYQCRQKIKVTRSSAWNMYNTKQFQHFCNISCNNWQLSYAEHQLSTSTFMTVSKQMAGLQPADFVWCQSRLYQTTETLTAAEYHAYNYILADVHTTRMQNKHNGNRSKNLQCKSVAQYSSVIGPKQQWPRLRVSQDLTSLVTGISKFNWCLADPSMSDKKPAWDVSCHSLGILTSRHKTKAVIIDTKTTTKTKIVIKTKHQSRPRQWYSTPKQQSRPRQWLSCQFLQTSHQLHLQC